MIAHQPANGSLMLNTNNYYHNCVSSGLTRNKIV
jgi:hypothetical protein